MANRERYREYDYGAGYGLGAEALLTRKGRPILDVRYRCSYIDVKNGSLWNPDLDDDGELYGSDATHHVHRFRARLNVPVTRELAIGAEPAQGAPSRALANPGRGGGVTCALLSATVGRPRGRCYKSS